MIYDSFDKIYEEYFDKVYNYIFGQMLNREISEDLTEDVFVKVLTNLDRYDPARGAKVSTWIFTIARNVVADYRKRAYVNREDAMDDSVELISRDDRYYFDDPSSLKYVENRKLFNILCRLTDDEKDFLGLRYGLEMTNDEIANMLNITPKAVSDRYSRLLNKCRLIHEKNS